MNRPEKELPLDQALSSTQRHATDLPVAGPTDHPVIAMPFHVEIDGRQYKGRGISLVRAEVAGLIDPHMAGLERMAWLVFRFQGFTVGLSVEVRMQDVDPAKGTATLVFVDPTGEHLPQLRHLINAYIAGDLVTLGQAMSIRPPMPGKPKGRQDPHLMRRMGGTLVLLVLTAALVGLVGSKVFQRVFTEHLSAPVIAGYEGRTLAATATGQIDFLEPEARAGEVAFAIRANTGQVYSVVMPCDCRVEALGVAAGSTVFAGDPVLRVSARDAGVVLTGFALPEETLDLARAQSVDLKFADGGHVLARLAPGGIGPAAPGEPVPVRLVPDGPIPEARLGQLAQATLRFPVPDFIASIARLADQLLPAARANAP
jgi:alginate biosynthesis protein Alg44